LLLLQALKADQELQPALARRYLHQWLAIPTWQRGPGPDTAWKEYIAWRLELPNPP
jgi:hypothetical protein